MRKYLPLTITSFSMIIVTICIILPEGKTETTTLLQNAPKVKGVLPLHPPPIPKIHKNPTVSTDNTLKTLKTESITPKDIANTKTDIFEKVTSQDLQLPELLGPGGGIFHIIDGNIYELDNGGFVRSTRLDIEGIKDITISIENYDSAGNKTDQGFFRGEELMIQTNEGDQNAITTAIAILNESNNYRIENSKIFVSIPYKKELDIIAYCEDLNNMLGGNGIASLIRKNF